MAAATLLMVAGVWSAAPASAAPSPAAPSITFQASAISGFSATSTYTLNRGPQQTASLACAVVRQDGSTTSASCGSVTRSSKESTTRSITLTPLTPGQYAYTVTAVLTDRNRVTASSTITVVPVRAACTVTGYDGTYDGAAKTATGTCTGIGGVALTGLDLSATTHTDAGTYDDAWTFTDTTGNYVNPGGTVTSRIGKATAACAVTGYDATYDGAAKTATGTCTGIGGVALTGLDLSATVHTDAGTYSDAWTFTDTTGNYVNPGGTVTSRIGQATAACTVTGYDVTFDGAARTASGGCTGIGGVALTGLDLSATTHTDAGTYEDAWTFTDTTGNHVDASGTVTSTIRRAVATAQCTVTGYDVTYTGTANTATGSCTGVGGVVLTGLDLSATTHTGAGSYDDTWTFTDPTGAYSPASGTVLNTIAKAAATCTVTGYDVIYNANNSNPIATGSCTGIGGVDVTSGLNLTGTVRSCPGNYFPAWSFSDANYSNPGGTVTAIIRPSSTGGDAATCGGGGGGSGGGGSGGGGQFV